ncbi:PREDICTED: circadian clock-controlled protein-like [Cyphomyrmex costatus]|uniref:circadian clock-controlled protein-like n=1 Tax=Cyphomyrmex costatus TaxID=456900 RepID=UPI0008523393|nr:PREDICTED: circadian clock-controlled protein-like [Cyphomyrmex costatus]
MASVKATFTILLTVATTGVIASRDIPEFLHVCQTSDPHYEECIRESIEHMKPYLKTGVPEYNIPSLEPLILKKLTFAPTSSLQLEASEIVTRGASNFIIKKAKIDLDTLIVLVDVELPNIQVEGIYGIDGKLLLLPIRGSGPIHGNFSNCIGACKIQIEKYLDEDGEEKMRIKDFKLKISVGKGMIKLDNLFGGEQALGDVINLAINNNFDIFLKELSPQIEKGLSDSFQDIASSIIQQFTFAQLFPGA